MKEKPNFMEFALTPESKILAVIPARAGSKGLPGKNLLPINGKPLIQWTIETALQVVHISKVVVTSDDEKILDLASSLGATAYERAPKLSGDFVQASEVMADAVNSFPGFDTLVYLQPTSPLRRQRHVMDALFKYDPSLKIPIVSVMEVSQPPEWMFTLTSDGRLVPYLNPSEFRRQDTQRRFVPNGAIYIGDIELLKSCNFTFSATNPIPYVMDELSSIDIDDKFDFEIAEWLLTRFNQ